jgi:dihydrofolate reductase
MAAGDLELVVAAAENDVIGRNNQLPWRLPADLKHFKSLTWGKPILMGSKTYRSIGKALPGRLNLVLTRSSNFAPLDCTIVRSLDDARRAALREGDAALMVIGGAEVYRQCLPHATCIHLTLVHARIEDGDTFFGGWRDSAWRETGRERHPADAYHRFDYSFVTLQRQPA